MLKFISRNYLPVLVLIVLFFDEIFHTLMLVSGTLEVHGIKQYGAILLSTIVYTILLVAILRHKIGRNFHHVLFFCGTLLIFYLITSIFYDGWHERYVSSLLLYGSESIPAACVGSLFARSSNIEKLNKWLPLFVVPLTFIMGSLGYAVAMSGSMLSQDMEDTGGLSYQNLSYYMAFSYTYCCYFVFHCSQKKTLTNKIIKLVCMVTLFFSAFVCVISGGRGGFISLVIVSFFLLFLYFKETKKNIVNIMLLFFSILIIALIIIPFIDASEIRGVSRISERLFDSSSREKLFENSFNAFLEAPWGNGLGSIFWINGIYSHNMILDLLAEIGIIGTFFFLFLLWKIMITLYRNHNYEPVLLFMLLVFIVNIIHYFFSGYWLGAHKLFLVCAFVYCYKYPKLRLNTKTLKNC